MTIDKLLLIINVLRNGISLGKSQYIPRGKYIPSKGKSKYYQEKSKS
jgi:hypothetical protein